MPPAHPANDRAARGGNVVRSQRRPVPRPRRSTADIGILLVRAGMDREHLYVGTSRGRHENHAHVAPDPVDDDHHIGPPPEALTHETARRVLVGCLARIGGQEAAHTLLDQAQRTAARTASLPDRAARSGPEPEPAADRYRQALQTYQDRSRDRHNLARDVLLLSGRVRITEQELRELPRLRRPGRRAELIAALETDRGRLDAALGRLQDIDDELPTLKRSLDDLQAETAQERPRPQTTYMRPMGRTPQPTPRRPAPAQPDPYRRLPPPVPHPNERGLGIGL